MAGTACAERFGELSAVTHRVIGFGGHPQVVGAELPLGVKGEGAQEVIPHEREQAEVHVSDTGPFQVVEAVALVERQDLAERADPVVGVGVLHQQLHGYTDRQRLGDGSWQTEQQQWGYSYTELERPCNGCFISPLKP